MKKRALNEVKSSNLVGCGDLVETKTYIQNKGWEWLGRVGTVKCVGGCVEVEFKNGDVSFFDFDQIRAHNEKDHRQERRKK